MTILLSKVQCVCVIFCALCIAFIFTCHTLVWQGIKFAVFSISGYRYLGDGGTDRREILHDGIYRSHAERSSPFWGGVARGSPKSEILGLNFGHFTANISKTASRSVTCQLQLN